MMEETSKKRRSSEAAGEKGFAGKRPRTPATAEEEDDGDMLAWLTMDDEKVTELSRLLESEIVSLPPFKVKFSHDPFFSPDIFQSSASYITINGNNDESCGSSFSESDSSVMASIDLGCWGFGLGRRGFPAEDGGAWYEAEEARVRVVGNEEGCISGGADKKKDGCDWSDGGFDFDDEMLAKFLGEDFMDLVWENEMKI